jgi:hypothetical protein
LSLIEILSFNGYLSFALHSRFLQDIFLGKQHKTILTRDYSTLPPKDTIPEASRGADSNPEYRTRYRYGSSAMFCDHRETDGTPYVQDRMESMPKIVQYLGLPLIKAYANDPDRGSILGSKVHDATFLNKPTAIVVRRTWFKNFYKRT